MVPRSGFANHGFSDLSMGAANRVEGRGGFVFETVATCGDPKGSAVVDAFGDGTE